MDKEMTEFKELVERRYEKLSPRYGISVVEGGLDMDEHCEYLTLRELLNLWEKGGITEDIFPEIERSFYFPSQEANMKGDLRACHESLSKVLNSIR